MKACLQLICSVLCWIVRKLPKKDEKEEDLSDQYPPSACSANSTDRCSPDRSVIPAGSAPPVPPIKFKQSFKFLQRFLFYSSHHPQNRSASPKRSDTPVLSSGGKRKNRNDAAEVFGRSPKSVKTAGNVDRSDHLISICQCGLVAQT